MKHDNKNPLRGRKPTAALPQVAPIADGVSAALLNTTVEAVTRLLEFTQPADAVLSAFFREKKSGAHDRAFIAETAYAVLRRKRLLESLASLKPSAKPSAKKCIAPRDLVLLSLSRVRGLSQRQLEPALLPDEAAWLAGIRHQPEPGLTLGEQLDFPDWLVERLGTRLPADELLALARALNASAPLDLRVNSLKANRDAALVQLNAEGISALPCPYSPLGIRLKSKPFLQKHPLYLDGSIEVQDEGSQLLGYLLTPKRGEMVVDFCAGAGGKTLLLGAMMRSTGRLYAFDVAEKRLAKLKPRMARAGLSNVHPILISNENDIRVKRLAGKVDRVLVDAPCSGLGTLRRNPDLKWRQSPQGVNELAQKQAGILTAAARLLKPGGRLVYATCSILDEENAAIVDAFLANHAEFHRLSAQEVLAAQGIAIDCGEDLRLSPHKHGTDGFYAAVLERAK
ncbi:MAG: RsmB/NOP family class I SAM-dependent RNA methyltransferase [Rugosibacter sp.]